MPAVLLILGLFGAFAGTTAYFFGANTPSNLGGPSALAVMPDGSLETDDPEAARLSIRVAIDERRLAADARDPRQLSDLTVRAAAGLRKRLGPGVKVTIEARGPASTPRIHAWTTREHGALTSDQFRSRVLRSGALTILPMALASDFNAAGTTEEVERGKVEAWIKATDQGELWAFNALPGAKGGPAPGIRWAWSTPNPGEDRRPLALAVPDDPKLIARGAWFSQVRGSSDHFGRPAVGLTTAPDHKDELEAATGAFIDRTVALVVGDDILIAPTVRAALRGGMVIEGGANGFAPAEVEELVVLLNHPMEGLPLVEVRR